MEAHSQLAAWETFYVIVGSSGAALTGLQFVVIALIAQSRRRATTREIAAFGTPTIIHFCAVLLIAAILSAPWHSLAKVAIALGVCGVCGVIYGLITIVRASRQVTYRPVFEDWLWHSILPMIAYTLILLTALFLQDDAQRALFLVGTAALLLLFVGIHNSWDTVTYITINQPEEGKEHRPRKRSRK
jgi:hypothetical protein